MDTSDHDWLEGRGPVRYQIQRADVQAGMRRQRLRVELQLDGELKACHQGRYLAIEECGARVEPNQSQARLD